MKPKLIILAAAGVAAVSVQAAQALELKMSLAPPAQSPPGKYALRLAEQVKKESGGKLTIKVFFNNQLGGSEQNVIRQIVRGRIDMGMNSNTAISLVAPEFALLTAPYLWTSLKEADCVADKHLLPVYDELLQKGGVVALTWVEIGQHILFAKDKTIKTPADLSGVKFRTAPTKTDTIYLQTAGANAIPLGTAESMPALKTGVVSGASFPIVFGLAVGYHKVAPNITVTKHSHQIGAVIISKKVWNRLSKEQQ